MNPIHWNCWPWKIRRIWSNYRKSTAFSSLFWIDWFCFNQLSFNALRWTRFISVDALWESNRLQSSAQNTPNERNSPHQQFQFSQNAKFSFRRFAAFNDGRFHNPVNSAENSFSNHKCVLSFGEDCGFAKPESAAEEQWSRFLNTVSITTKLNFGVQTKDFARRRKKEGKQALYFCHFVCVILSGIAQL